MVVSNNENMNCGVSGAAARTGIYNKSNRKLLGKIRIVGVTK